jgi:4-oxalocrotonate tautomerase
MPLLKVALSAPPDLGRTANIASILTMLTNEYLGKDPALTAVTIRYVEQDHWFIGSQALGERDPQSFSLHVSVTQGTNVKPQIAAYIAAVFSNMEKILGEIRDESYVIVDEIPAAAWGYAGKTQEYRLIAG